MNDIFSKLLLISLIMFAVSCGKNKHHHDSETQPDNNLTDDEQGVDGTVRLRGYSELSQIMESNMMISTGEFSLSNYVDREVNYFSETEGLAPLMGYFNNDPLNAHWQNTDSNSVSTAVYLIAFEEFAKDMTLICNPSNSPQPNEPQTYGQYKKEIKFNDHMKQLTLKYCEQGSAMPNDELKQLWQEMTLHHAPDSDYEDWSKALSLVDGKPNAEKIDFLVSISLTSPWVMFHY